MPQLFDSVSFLKTVTNQSGVYRMYNIEAVVIYVGKAKDLKKRLTSYF
ncbi:GIY-YIG nuclease family protein, partial [Vibrio genomosp. F10]